MRLKKLLHWRIFLLLCGLFLLNTTVSAQGALTYGSGTTSTLDGTTPIGFYTFSGTENDSVTIQVLAFTAGLQPTISLNGPSQQQLAINTGDPFNAGTARLTYQLPQTGLYTILVSGNGGTGDYAIRLDGSPALETSDVSEQAPATGTFDGTVPSQVYAVMANPDAPTNVTVSSASPAFTFTVAVRNSSGQTIATLTGSDTQPIVATLPQGTETYTLDIRPLVVGTAGDVQVSLSTVAPTNATPAPPTTDAPAPTPIPDTVCRVSNTSGGGINVRSGAGTNFNIVGTLLPGAERIVLGVDSSAGWYLIPYDIGVQGWVFGDVVTVLGDCSTVDEVTAPPTPLAPTAAGSASPPPTATYTPTTQTGDTAPMATATATMTGQQEATPTYTPSYTPTTVTAQIAPEDTRFNSPLNIALDSTASVLDFVSYPEGDSEDRVRWDITGMNSNSSLSGGRANLVISVTCFGTNTDQIEIFTGGQTYGCGDTIVDEEVTFNSKTGSVIITAVGGEGTYVQWVLTGTATRVN